MLLQMGPLLHLGPVITLVPLTHLPARFLKVKSHRFSFYHLPGYHTYDKFMFKKTDFVVVNISNSYEEKAIETSSLKEPKELIVKDLDQHAETYQVRPPILTKLTRHCRTRWFFFSSFFLLSSPSSIRSLSLIATYYSGVLLLFSP